MAESATGPGPAPPPVLRVGLGLVLAGVWLAAVDAIVDATILIWLATGALEADDLGELWLVTGARLVGYALAIVAALVLRRGVVRRRDRSRLGLAGLLLVFFVSGFANLGLSWYALLSAALGGELAQPVPVWLNNLALTSMVLDVILMAVALVAAILLLAARRWTRPEPEPDPR